MRTWVAGAAAVAVAAAGTLVAAQTARPSDAEQGRARQRISMMERVFEGAVSNGADNLLRQARRVTQDIPMLSGAPEARGFRLEGYGVFFDVEVPALRLPITWMLRSTLDPNAAATSSLAELRSIVNQMNPREVDRLEPVLRRLEAQLGGPRNAATRRAAGVSAANAGAQALTPPPAAPVEPDVLENPNNAYTTEVKTALMEAMIENSAPLALGLDEWLTVAARDNVPRDPLVPGDTTDFSTVIFRVKGADLAAFRAGRMTVEEVRKRVEVREY